MSSPTPPSKKSEHFDETNAEQTEADKQRQVESQDGDKRPGQTAEETQVQTTEPQRQHADPALNRDNAHDGTDNRSGCVSIA